MHVEKLVEACRSSKSNYLSMLFREFFMESSILSWFLKDMQTNALAILFVIFFCFFVCSDLQITL